MNLVEDGLVIETLMWNPLHFAVYYGHLEIIKFIIANLNVNIGLSAHKPNSESEKDPTNSVSFPEDKILLLLMAVAKNHTEVLKYLLNNLSMFWSNKNFKNFIDKLPTNTDKINI